MFYVCTCIAISLAIYVMLRADPTTMWRRSLKFLRYTTRKKRKCQEPFLFYFWLRGLRPLARYNKPSLCVRRATNYAFSACVCVATFDNCGTMWRKDNKVFEKMKCKLKHRIIFQLTFVRVRTAICVLCRPKTDKIHNKFSAKDMVECRQWGILSETSCTKQPPHANGKDCAIVHIQCASLSMPCIWANVKSVN